jgi:hypothetical protein
MLGGDPYARASPAAAACDGGAEDARGRSVERLLEMLRAPAVMQDAGAAKTGERESTGDR